MIYKKTILIITMFLAIALSTPSDVDALSCASVDAKRFIQHNGVIFIGSVVSDIETSLPAFGEYTSQEFDTSIHKLVFSVDYLWTNENKKRIDADMLSVYDSVSVRKGQAHTADEDETGDVWGFTRRFDVGKKYLVFAKKSDNSGRLNTNIGTCARSVMFDDDSDVIEYKDKITLEASNLGYRPSGVIVNKGNTISIEERIQFLLDKIASLQQRIFKKTFIIEKAEEEKCLNLEHNLYLGARDINTDGDVSRLQEFLKKIGIYGGYVGGYFGPLTEKAVKDWQIKYETDNEITEQQFIDYGIVDVSTRDKMKCLEPEGPEFIPLTDEHVLGKFSQEQYYALVKIGNAISKTKKFIDATEKTLKVFNGYLNGQYVCDVEILNTGINTPDDIRQNYDELAQARNTLKTLDIFNSRVRLNDRTTLSSVLGLSTLGTRVPSHKYTEFKLDELNSLDKECYQISDGNLMTIRPMTIPILLHNRDERMPITADSMKAFSSKLHKMADMHSSVIASASSMSSGCNDQEFIEQKVKWLATGAEKSRKELVNKYIPTVDMMGKILEDDVTVNTIARVRRTIDEMTSVRSMSMKYAVALKYRVDTLVAMCSL